MSSFRVRGMDHIVLNVSDGERSLAWYRDRLGLEVLRADAWREGKVPFVSLRVSDTCIIDLFEIERRVAGDAQLDPAPRHEIEFIGRRTDRIHRGSCREQGIEIEDRLECS